MLYYATHPKLVEPVRIVITVMVLIPVAVTVCCQQVGPVGQKTVGGHAVENEKPISTSLDVVIACTAQKESFSFSFTSPQNTIC